MYRYIHTYQCTYTACCSKISDGEDFVVFTVFLAICEILTVNLSVKFKQRDYTFFKKKGSKLVKHICFSLKILLYM